MKMRKIISLITAIAMVMTLFSAISVNAEGQVTAFDIKNLTISGEVVLDGTGWNASENGASVRWNQNWTNQGTWASGTNGTYGLMFFASKARETGGGNAKATFADATKTLRSEQMDITFNFACQEKENLYQRWNFYDNDNNVFATFYFDKNEKAFVGKGEAIIVDGKEAVYGMRGKEMHISVLKKADGKYSVTYTFDNKRISTEEIESVNGFKAIAADVPSYNDQWGAAALLNLKIAYAPNNSVSEEEKAEYALVNTSPKMNVSGGSQSSLIDCYEPITITHPGQNNGAQIYYTLDGTEPSKDSIRYEGPFHVGGAANIKACAITEKGSKSDIASAWVYSQEWAATAAEYRMEGENTVNNAKIAWPLYPNADKYEVYRDDKLIGVATGDCYDEYDLEVNKNYVYTVKAYNGDELIATGTTNKITTFAYDISEVSGYDDNTYANGYLWNPNPEFESEPSPGGYHINGKYYSINRTRLSDEEIEALGIDTSTWNGAKNITFRYKESDDGFTWPEEWTNIYPIFVDVGVEGAQTGMHYDKESIVFSAHAEGSGGGYGMAKIMLVNFRPGRDAEDVKPYAVMLAGGKVIAPSAEPEQSAVNENAGRNEVSAWYVGRPFGHDSRDMVRFSEKEKFYTVSCADGNQNSLIVKYDDEYWVLPEKEVNVFNKGQHQESPAMFKYDGAYYCYTSTTNGWFLSQARYTSAFDLEGDWAPLREIGNSGTFATQANGVWGYGSESGRLVERAHGYNWGQSGGWRKRNGDQGFWHMALNNGVATMNWTYHMEYHPYWGAVAVSSGEYVSLGKKATVEGKDAPGMTDNVQLQSTPVTEVSSLPYDIIVDLEVPTVITEVNLTTDIYMGSACASYFKVFGSNDQVNWTEIADATGTDYDNPTFKYNPIEDKTPYRYIKATVYDVKNIQGNRSSALWGGKPQELAIYGKPVGWEAEYYDVSAQNEILVGYDRNNIDFTPYGQEPVIVDDRTLVPLRAIFEAMGAEVEWDDATKTVSAVRDETEISLTIGSDQLIVNGEAVTIDVPAQIINERTMVPVRAIAESFGCEVNWNQTAKRVYISEAE